jgi:hypothetical protein
MIIIDCAVYLDQIVYKRSSVVSYTKSLYLISCSDRAHTLLISVLALLQKNSNLPEVVPPSCTEEHPTTSNDGIEIINIKVGAGTEVKKTVDPVPITFTAVVKKEHEVSSVSVSPVLDMFHKYP